MRFPNNPNRFVAAATTFVQADEGPGLQPIPDDAFEAAAAADSPNSDDDLLGEKDENDDGTRKLTKDDYQESWREAGDGEDRLGTRLRTHVVRLQEDGSLLGKISLINPADGQMIPISQVTVRFVRNGVPLKEFTPNPDGSFASRV